jgi:hypothetical protein
MLKNASAHYHRCHENNAAGKKPRFLPGAPSPPPTEQCPLQAPHPIPRGQKPRLLLAAQSIANLNSAEIAAGDFSQ